MDSLYQTTAGILDKTIAREHSLRTGVYNSDFKNKKQLLRMCCETLKYLPFLEKIFEAKNVKNNLLRCSCLNDDKWLCLVLLYETIFGKGVSTIDRKVRKAFSKAEKDIHSEVELLSEQGVTPDSLARNAISSNLPRYARVNMLKTSMVAALKALNDDGFILISNEKIKNSKRFREAVKSLGHRDFFVDRHIDNLLVFAPELDLHANRLVNDGALILQDKASCLSAFVLRPKPGSEVVDACAAPGMKTSHLADLMHNNGSIWAYEKNERRSKVLSEMLEFAGVTMANVETGDFLRLDTASEEFSKVEFAIVDPPCSGSGMAKRGDFLEEEMNESRVRSLSNLQSMLLKHALRMPNLKRLVYSTCSVHELENEGVVAEALANKTICQRFELVDPLMGWKHRGVEEYDFGGLCLRSDPTLDLTNGFFVALFQAKNYSS